MATDPVPISGLARRLVDEGILDAEAAAKASDEARKQGAPFVTYLVQNGLAESRAIAGSASEEFGVPLIDLSSFDLDSIPRDLVKDKLIRQHNALPLPVGPVTRIMPCGRNRASINSSFWSSSNPSASIPILALEGSKIRSTIFSPQSVGRVLTRKSMARVFDSFILMRPSCGSRRSDMSSSDMTFRRAANRVPKLVGGVDATCKIPSVRKRTR